jgi:hypothetical protein
MKCSVCGYEFEDGKLRCPLCGTRAHRPAAPEINFTSASEAFDVKRDASEDSEPSWNTYDFPKPRNFRDITMRWPSFNAPQEHSRDPEALEAAAQSWAEAEALANQQAARMAEERAEAARREAARLEAEKAEAARIAAEKAEAARREAARAEAEKAELARLEAAKRDAALKEEQARQEAEKAARQAERESKRGIFAESDQHIPSFEAILKAHSGDADLEQTVSGFETVKPEDEIFTGAGSTAKTEEAPVSEPSAEDYRAQYSAIVASQRQAEREAAEAARAVEEAAEKEEEKAQEAAENAAEEAAAKAEALPETDAWAEAEAARKAAQEAIAAEARKEELSKEISAAPEDDDYSDVPTVEDILKEGAEASQDAEGEELPPDMDWLRQQITTSVYGMDDAAEDARQTFSSESWMPAVDGTVQTEEVKPEAEDAAAQTAAFTEAAAESEAFESQVNAEAQQETAAAEPAEEKTETAITAGEEPANEEAPEEETIDYVWNVPEKAEEKPVDDGEFIGFTGFTEKAGFEARRHDTPEFEGFVKHDQEEEAARQEEEARKAAEEAEKAAAEEAARKEEEARKAAEAEAARLAQEAAEKSEEPHRPLSPLEAAEEEARIAAEEAEKAAEEARLAAEEYQAAEEAARKAEEEARIAAEEAEKAAEEEAARKAAEEARLAAEEAERAAAEEAARKAEEEARTAAEEAKKAADAEAARLAEESLQPSEETKAPESVEEIITDPVNMYGFHNAPIKEGEEKRPEKFFTFTRKNEEFQQLLNQEYERIRRMNALEGVEEAVQPAVKTQIEPIATAAAAAAASGLEDIFGDKALEKPDEKTQIYSKQDQKSQAAEKSEAQPVEAEKPSDNPNVIPAEKAVFAEVSSAMGSDAFRKQTVETKIAEMKAAEEAEAKYRSERRKKLEEMQRARESYFAKQDAAKEQREAQNVSKDTKTKGLDSTDEESAKLVNAAKDGEQTQSAEPQDTKHSTREFDSSDLPKDMEQDEFEYEPRHRHPLLKFFAVLILLLGIGEGTVIGMRFFIPDSPATETANQIEQAFVDAGSSAYSALKKQIDKLIGLVKQKTGQEPEVVDIQDGMDFPALAASVNKNIKSVWRNPELVYSDATETEIEGLADSTPVEDLAVKEAVYRTMIGYNSSWVDYVNKADETVLSYLKADRAAYRSAASYTRKGEVEETFEELQLGEIRDYGNGVYIFVKELISLKDGQNVSTANFNWIYDLEKVGDEYKIVNYKSFK